MNLLNVLPLLLKSYIIFECIGSFLDFKKFVFGENPNNETMGTSEVEAKSDVFQMLWNPFGENPSKDSMCFLRIADSNANDESVEPYNYELWTKYNEQLKENGPIAILKDIINYNNYEIESNTNSTEFENPNISGFRKGQMLTYNLLNKSYMHSASEMILKTLNHSLVFQVEQLLRGNVKVEELNKFCTGREKSCKIVAKKSNEIVYSTEMIGIILNSIDYDDTSFFVRLIDSNTKCTKSLNLNSALLWLSGLYDYIKQDISNQKINTTVVSLKLVNSNINSTCNFQKNIFISNSMDNEAHEASSMMNIACFHTNKFGNRINTLDFYRMRHLRGKNFKPNVENKKNN
ncbi:hypothetical protein EDEG_02364 [Edhazardia aedis USNM 41457]|uniref:Uncharacterized protein n=1 Tax=Edhazardia aedis (strain USNM 41457) TaxID=1003232 RepID=J8ZUE8_EDHAE|nr:hypothetical protein EDEG_02364 [Edhazardia aedis USNM 41457]|eukprot:EJW03298.1 hypothetical protein EDEG_02364 [Edhazardia aedis USNM 41457]